jgi:hypothetical protein
MGRRDSKAAAIREEWIVALFKLAGGTLFDRSSTAADDPRLRAREIALAFADLGRGIVHPALRPAGAPGRPALSLAGREARVLAVLLVDVYGQRARQRSLRGWQRIAIEDTLIDWRETATAEHWPLTAAALKVLRRRVHQASAQSFEGLCYRDWQRRLPMRHLREAIDRIRNALATLAATESNRKRK